MGYGDSAEEGERLKGVAGMEGTVLCGRCIVEDGRGIGMLCVAEGREAAGRATIDAVGEDDEETVGGNEGMGLVERCVGSHAIVRWQRVEKLQQLLVKRDHVRIRADMSHLLVVVHDLADDDGESVS